MLNCISSFALNIRDVDLMNNNPIGSIIADSLLILFIALFLVLSCVSFIIRLFHIVLRKEYTFEKETALCVNKEYLKEWLKYKRIEEDFYASIEAYINADEMMRMIERRTTIRIVQPGEKYVKCGLNILSDYLKVRLVEDNKVYYMYSN